MFISLFNINVEEVSSNPLAVCLRLKDTDGNTVTLFFDDLTEVKEFSRDVRRAALDEADRLYQDFERPALITDVTRKGV